MSVRRAARLLYRRSRLRVSLVAAVVLTVAKGVDAQPGPGEVVIAWHVTITPSWFDPSTPSTA